MALSSKIIQEIVALTHDGWRPYGSQPESFVYEKIGCTQYKKIRPNWFFKGDMYICLGCASRCCLQRPEGFQLLLPIKYPNNKGKIQFTRTPQELVQCKQTLNINEVSYCLNVSYSKVYAWIQEGKLIALREKPLRVRAEDVKKMMEDFDE